LLSIRCSVCSLQLWMYHLTILISTTAFTLLHSLAIVNTTQLTLILRMHYIKTIIIFLAFPNGIRCCSGNDFSFTALFMIMEQWWIDTDKGKPIYAEKTLFQCHSVGAKSHRLVFRRCLLRISDISLVILRFFMVSLSLQGSSGIEP
jgi:hypothetical protein